MNAYYNDNDPNACAWLRELITAGVLPKGTVDERPIQEVQAKDLAGHARVALFAGIGGWEYALQLAGWDAARPVWTCSCPCPPFSTAGKKKACPACAGTNPIPCPRRTGFFICGLCEHAWLADARHLWPEAWRLIRECKPTTIFGEQVSGADGRIWFAGVRASLELLGYAVGAADLAAGSVGAPHIRQRLFWVANAERPARRAGSRRRDADRKGHDGGVGDTLRSGQQEPSQRDGDAPQDPAHGDSSGTDAHRSGDRAGVARGVEHPASNGRGQGDSHQRGSDCGIRAEGDGCRPADTGEPCRVGNAQGTEAGASDDVCEGREQPDSRSASRDGFWDDYGIVWCRDPAGGPPVARRVEPGTFPLAHGIPGRVGLLRGYGNAICPEVTAVFIQAYMHAKGP